MCLKTSRKNTHDFLLNEGMFVEHCTHRCMQQGASVSADSATHCSQNAMSEHRGTGPEIPACGRIEKETQEEAGGDLGKELCLQGICGSSCSREVYCVDKYADNFQMHGVCLINYNRFLGVTPGYV